MIKKTHKKSFKNLTYSFHLLKFGSFGFKILSDLRLTTEQRNSLERSLVKKLRSFSSQTKKYKIWSHTQTNKTLTKLSLESRMGKGKGLIYTEVLFLKKGSMIYEFKNLTNQQIREVFNFIRKQISVKLLLVSKN